MKLVQKLSSPLLHSLTLTALILISSTAFANLDSAPVYRPTAAVTKATDNIKIDGNLTDRAWIDAVTINNFVERYPGDNTKPLVDTKVMVTYDEDNLYVGFVCYDDPSKIRATMCQRDQFDGDDAVCVLLDTYGDANWAYKFFVNPYGVQKDWLWTNIIGDDSGFDLIWNSAAKITESGYQVEIAVPFTSVRFPNREVQNWKMDFWRNHPRESYHQYSWAAYDRNEQCDPCQWGTIEGIHDVHPGKGIEILPTVIATQAGAVTDAYDPALPFDNENIDGELSLGGKYAINSDVTAEVSYNPDFSQIEADATQIDVNNPVALYFPERRPFFQEGQDIFRTLFNSFYTRTINDPQFAAKLTGRGGRYRFGVVSAVDENSYYIIPLEESSVGPFNVGKSYVNIFRAMRSFGESSQLGFQINDRRYEGGGYNTVAAIDQRIRLSRNYFIDGQYIATATGEANNPSLNDSQFALGGKMKTVAFDGESFTGYGFITRFHRNSRHWNFFLDYNQVDKNYRTETGYDPWVNYRNFAAWNGYNIYFDRGFFERVTPQVYTETRWNFEGERKWTHLNMNVESRIRMAQTYLSLSYNIGNELWNGTKFNDLWEASANLNTTLNSQIGFYLDVHRGVGPALNVLEKGNEFSYSVGFNLKPIDRILLEPDFSYLKSNHTVSDEKLFENYVMRTRLRCQVTRALSLRLVVQYAFRESLYPVSDEQGNVQNVYLKNRHWDIDPLITFRLSPFSVFYIGTTLDYDPLPSDPYPFVSPTPDPNYDPNWGLSSRQFFMKLQYLFQT